MAAGGALLLTGAEEIATLAGGPRRGAAQDEVGLLRGGAPPGHPEALGIAIRDGTILAVGPEGSLRAELDAAGVGPDELDILDVSGCTLTPGLIDPHTHLLFCGTREAEWELRRHGATYLEILAAGGGILSTVERTRAASDEELLAHGRRWLREMHGNGVTTIEAKSGYGLDTATELRLLELSHRLGREGPIEIVSTFMGAHAVPAALRERTDGTEMYVSQVIEEQLPAVAEQGVARFCDVFCEAGVFDSGQARRVLETGARLGLRPRLHADELHPSGGAELAAEVGAASADHLGAISEQGIDALASAAEEGHPVVAVLLPATGLVLGRQGQAPARRLIERGIPVALGTDFNPGTSPTSSLPLVLSLACLLLGMTPAEALAAATINAALALGLEETHGSLEPGRQADIVCWRVSSHQQIPYWLGADLVQLVFKRGRLVDDDGATFRTTSITRT